MKPDNLLTITQAAELLGISKQSAYQAVRRGSLVCYIQWIGWKKFVFVAIEDVQEYKKRTQPDGIKSKGRPKKDCIS